MPTAGSKLLPVTENAQLDGAASVSVLPAYKKARTVDVLRGRPLPVAVAVSVRTRRICILRVTDIRDEVPPEREPRRGPGREAVNRSTDGMT